MRKPQPKDYEAVRRRVAHLITINEPYTAERTKIRKLMNGGKGAVEVLLKGLENNEDTLPAANHIKSGIERFSEMISPPPDLYIDPPGNSLDDPHLRAAAKRERIVSSYDERSRHEHQLAQASLWLVGYGFYSWKICEARDRNGIKFPKAELRDPYTTFPAEWGVDQQPNDIAYTRYVDPMTLGSVYPRAKSAMEARIRGNRLVGGAYDLSTIGSANTHAGWDGSTGGVQVIEYVDDWGTYVYSPEVDGFLDRYEHPLNRAPIVVPRRITFDQQQGQFSDVIGLASTMAKLTLLSQIVMEDAAFAPLVVTGRHDGDIVKGRDSVIKLDGGDAKYVHQNIPYQMFQEIDRIDGHLRSTTGYSRQADGESPISFVTGQGLEELGSSMARQVERYFLVLRYAHEDKDAIQLEWDEKAYGDESRKIDGTRKGKSFSEEYVPSKDIAGLWRTKRKYGMMAGLDEARRGVAMLQYNAAGIIPRKVVRENLRDIDNPMQVEDALVAEQIEDTLFASLNAMAQQGDERALGAVVRIKKSPKDMQDILDEFFDPEEQEAPQQAAPPSPQDEMAQVLTRLTSAGESQGGVQTVREVG